MNDTLRVHHRGAFVDVAGRTRVVIGRSADADIVTSGTYASRHHCELALVTGRWTLRDLGSSNGTWVGGNRVDHVSLPAGSYVVGLGDPADDSLAITVTAAARPGTPAAGAAAPAAQPAGEHTVMAHPTSATDLIVGRGEDCAIQVIDPIASRHHLRLRLGARASVTDLGSFNGTFVNGTEVRGEHPVRPGDVLLVGNTSLVFDGTGLRVHEADVALQVDDLTIRARGGAVLLDQVSLAIPDRSLVGVIGPSGAGKSTFLGAISGARRPSGGAVHWNGHDLHANFEVLRSHIGMVPQQDIQHPQLRVHQALRYSARLRLPPDTQDAEREARIGAVLNQLQLGEHAEKRIGAQLSGGQRKRVSIATELLTAPPLLLLDEPTSGLDPALDHEVMQLLRHLADDGRVVVTVTHNTQDLDLCDRLLVLAPGGSVAYFGPPSGVFAHFGVSDYRGVFEAIAANRIPAPRPSSTPAPTTAPAPLVARPGPPFLRQIATLSARTLAVARADPMLVGLLVAMPLALAGLAHIVAGHAGLSMHLALPADPHAETDSGPGQRLTIMIAAACLMGLALTVRELIKERAILEREHSVGLSLVAYWLAKCGVFGGLAFLQGLLFALLALAGVRGPDHGGLLHLGRLEIVVPIALTTAAMALVGLALSAVVKSSEQAMPALVASTMLTLVLSGALLPITRERHVLMAISWLSPSRWGYGAAGASVDLNQLQTHMGRPADPMLTHTAAHWWAGVAVAVVLGVAYALTGYAVLRSRHRQ